MQSVAIFGAGELGGQVAHLLARRDVARAIVLLDDAGTVAAGKALDIAQAVLFLASPLAEYMTGEVVAVNGGTSAGRTHLPLSTPRGR